MTREAGGSPFVLEQLARYAGVDRRSRAARPRSRRCSTTRLDALPPDARRFLETLAICGRPMAPELVCDACGIARDRQSLVAMLRSSRLIRSSGSSERIETYHDRIREVLAARDRARCRAADPRPHGAGARREAERRLRGAVRALSRRRRLRERGDSGGPGRREGRRGARLRPRRVLLPSRAGAGAGIRGRPRWREGLAPALANAGRPAEAAEAYLRAAPGAGRRAASRAPAARGRAVADRRAHRSRAGSDSRRARGHGDGVCREAPRGAAVVVVATRTAPVARAAVRARRAEDIDAETLLRVDTCWSATTGLLLVDMIGASDFSARHLLMALDAGEPYRIARAMAIESAARAVYPSRAKAEPRSSSSGRRRWRRASETRRRSHCPSWRTASWRRQWANGRRRRRSSEQALAILRDQCVGVTWEMNIAQNLVIWAADVSGRAR